MTALLRLFARWVQRLTRLLCAALAVIGGVVLGAAALLSVVSIIGRNLIVAGLDSVPGQEELVAMACAFALFCFAPWCLIQRGNVTVELFAGLMGRRIHRATTLFGLISLGVIAALILWRLIEGMNEKYDPWFMETTFILQIPVWIGYALCLPGAGLLVLAAIVAVAEEAALMWRGAPLAESTPNESGDEPG